MEDATQELKNYQLSYLLPSTITDEEFAHAREELVNILQEQGANVVQTSEALKRKLAYPIARQAFAFTGKMVFLAKPNTIPALSSSLLHDGNLLRFLVTKKETADSALSSGNEERFTETRRRKGPETYAEKRNQETPQEERIQAREEMPRKDQEKITIEDIDRKLDEIMKNIQ